MSGSCTAPTSGVWTGVRDTVRMDSLGITLQCAIGTHRAALALVLKGALGQIK